MVQGEAALIGLVNGGAYALIAVSVTLMFRTTGVLSFAHAAIAAVTAYAYSWLTVDVGWPVGAAAVAALVLGVVWGLLVERVAVRPVMRASVTTRLIATLGALQLTSGLLIARFGVEARTAPSLLPQRSLELFGVRFTVQQLVTLAIALAFALGVGALLQRTRLGLALRATAQQTVSAQLVGMDPALISRVNWTLAAVASGIAGIMVAPLAAVTVLTFPLLLSKSLVATLVGGMASLPLTFAGGLLIGAVESITVVSSSTPGAPALAVFGVVVVTLIVRRRWLPDPVGTPPESTTPRWTMPPRVAALAWRATVVAGAIGAVVAIVMPLQSGFWAYVGALCLFYVLEALSLVVLAGWAGQISLMHGAYVGIGAFVASWLATTHGVPLILALPLAGVAGMVLGALAGVPALRQSSVQFAIASTAFAAAATDWLFRLPMFRGELARGRLLGADLFHDANLFLAMAITTAVLLVVVWRYRQSTLGTLLIASRSMPGTVAQFGARPRRVRLGAFLLASFIASLGGAFYGLLVSRFQPADFNVGLSIALLVYAVVGGLRSMAGPIVAALVFGLLPQLLQSEAGASASALPDIVAGVAVLALVALRPMGLASLLPRPVSGPVSRFALGRMRPALESAPAPSKEVPA